MNPEFLGSKRCSDFQTVPKKLVLKNTNINRLIVCEIKRKSCDHPVKPSFTASELISI